MDNKKKRRFPLSVFAVLLALITLAGFVAVAVESGSSSDPLISLSYLENVFTPAVEDKTEALWRAGRLDTELSDTLAVHAGSTIRCDPLPGQTRRRRGDEIMLRSARHLRGGQRPAVDRMTRVEH